MLRNRRQCYITKKLSLNKAKKLQKINNIKKNQTIKHTSKALETYIGNHV